MIEIEWKGQKISFTDMKDFIEFEKIQKAENGQTKAVIQDLIKDEKAIVKRAIALDHPRRIVTVQQKSKPHGWRHRRFVKNSKEIINEAVSIIDRVSAPIGITELVNRVLGHHSGPDIERVRNILKKPIRDGFIKTWIGNRRQKYYSNKMQFDPDEQGYVRNKTAPYKHHIKRTERPIKDETHPKARKQRAYGTTMNTLLANIVDVIIMYKTKNAKQIAKKYGLSECAVRNAIFILQKQDKLQKKRYPGKQEEHIKFVLDNMDKMTRGDLARALGVKRNTISNYMWHLKKRGKISDVEAKADVEKVIKPKKAIPEPQYMQRDHPVMQPKCADCSKPLPLGHGHIRCFDCNQLRLKEKESAPFSWDVMATGYVSEFDLRPIIERMISHKEPFDYLTLSTALKPKEVSFKNFEKIVNKLFLYQKDLLKACNGNGKFVYNSNLKQVEFRGDLA